VATPGAEVLVASASGKSSNIWRASQGNESTNGGRGFNRIIFSLLTLFIPFAAILFFYEFELLWASLGLLFIYTLFMYYRFQSRTDASTWVETLFDVIVPFVSVVLIYLIEVHQAIGMGIL